MALWRRTGLRETLINCASLVSGEADWRNYSGLQKRLTQGCRRNRLQVIWILLEECFPHEVHRPESSGAPLIKLPQWMESCWNLLPLNCVPDHVQSGTACLAAALSGEKWLRPVGTAAFFTLDERAFLVAPGNGQTYTRVSRSSSAGYPVPGREWLQQSAMLMTSRTGQQLREVKILHHEPVPLEETTGAPLLTAVGGPPDWIKASTADGALPDAGLHAVVARCPEWHPVSLPMLERRQRLLRLDRTLRWSTTVLLTGWLLLLLGACRQYQPQRCIAGPEATVWRDQALRWSQKHLLWKEALSQRQDREAVFHIVEAIADSAPEGLLLDNIRTRRLHGRSGTEVHLEGSLEGGDASGVFREWFTRMDSGKLRPQIRNLHLDKGPRGLDFHLVGEFPGGGSE